MHTHTRSNMKIDDTYKNTVSGVANSVSYCSCSGSDPVCPKCHGTGQIFLPFVCLFEGCKEGFQSLQELDSHMQSEHNAAPLSYQ
jgi:hypothetical protein